MFPTRSPISDFPLRLYVKDIFS